MEKPTRRKLKAQSSLLGPRGTKLSQKLRVTYVTTADGLEKRVSIDPGRINLPTLASTGPEQPPTDPADEDEAEFQPDISDNKFVVKLGDCRRCSQNLSQNADLILVNALKFGYASLANAINYTRPIEAAVPARIPINAAQVLQLIALLGGGQKVPASAPLSSLVYFPQINFFENQDPNPEPEDLWAGRASPTEIGQFWMTSTAHAYQLWRNSKRNQKDCCKKKILLGNLYKPRVRVMVNGVEKRIRV